MPREKWSNHKSLETYHSVVAYLILEKAIETFWSRCCKGVAKAPDYFVKPYYTCIQVHNKKHGFCGGEQQFRVDSNPLKRQQLLIYKQEKSNPCTTLLDVWVCLLGTLMLSEEFQRNISHLVFRLITRLPVGMETLRRAAHANAWVTADYWEVCVKIHGVKAQRIPLKLYI